MRLLVIQHEDTCPPGLLGQWWRELGCELDVVHGHRGQAIPGSLEQAGADGLVVLGGNMGAGDDEDCAWLAPVRDLIAGTVRSGGPFLGVCLGHQLAGMALGGRVGRNPSGVTVGLTPFAVTERGRADEVVGGIGQEAVAVHWNRDVVLDLPPDAALLATAPDASVQAVRYGARAWGVQSHPECDESIFAGWLADEPERVVVRGAGLDPTQVVASIGQSRARLTTTWKPVAKAFLDAVHGVV